MKPQESETELFNEWSLALNNHFFGPHLAGKRTRLTVNKDFLNEEFGFIGGFRGLISSLEEGPQWSFPIRDPGFHEKALSTYKIWKRSQRPAGYPELPDNAPPYLPFLVGLCLAWTLEDEASHLAGNDFYGRLALLFPSHGMNSPELKLWKPLWTDLEKWSEERGGDRGIWRVETIGYAHVGIPCSQAIMTPCKVRRLPWLFHHTGLSLAGEHGKLDDQVLVNHLWGTESYTRAVLGDFLTAEIRKATDIGKGVVKLLSEHLQNPDMRAYEGDDQNGKSDPNEHDNRTVIEARYSLEYTGTNSGWKIRLSVLDETPPKAVGHSGNWKFRKVEHKLGGLWIAQEGDVLFDATPALKHHQGYIEKEYPYEDESGVLNAIMRTRKRNIRIFRWINRRFLVEEFKFPVHGDCYLLVESESGEAFTRWLDIFVSNGGCTQEITQTGISSVGSLHYIDGIDKVGRDVLNEFPESKARSLKGKYLFLQGGSRIHDSGAERVYLTYDLPTVVVHSAKDFILEASGADLIEEIGVGDIDSELPGQQIREFELRMESSSPSITLTLKIRDTGTVCAIKTFGITEHQLDLIALSDGTDLRFDSFGQPTDHEGVSGALLDPKILELLSDEIPEVGHLNATEWITKYFDRVEFFDYDHRWSLLESIRETKRVTSSELRRRAEKITGDWEDYAWSDLKWLRALGHIEIQRDKKGRIAYIYPVRPHSYMIPIRSPGKSYFCITGCPSRGNLVALKENIETLGCRVWKADRCSQLLPPAILVEGEEEDVKICLKDAGFLVNDGIVSKADSYFISAWAGTLDVRQEHFSWMPDNIQEPEAIFNPYQFQMRNPKSFSCPYKLYSVADSYSSCNKWHALVKTPGINDSETLTKHVFLKDISWGKWLSIGKASEGIPENIDAPRMESVPIPYDSETYELTVPASARFPTILCRALLMCSGMPPKVIRKSSYYTEKQSIYLPDPEMPYDGACYVYPLIPPHIAQVVCDKVSAWPVDLKKSV